MAEKGGGNAFTPKKILNVARLETKEWPKTEGQKARGAVRLQDEKRAKEIKIHMSILHRQGLTLRGCTNPSCSSPSSGPTLTRTLRTC